MTRVVSKKKLSRADSVAHSEILYRTIKALAHMGIIYKFGYNYGGAMHNYRDSFIMVLREVPCS